MTYTIAIILGTRPEIIKMSPIIRECECQDIAHFILHTGQHYSYEMDKIFFEDLDLPQPKFNLDIGSGSHANQTGRMMRGIEKVLQNNKPDIVLVQGDTNTVLAGALTASKMNIKVGHVEAGLRSFDRSMPEEINRILTDHISDLLFAPTKESQKNLFQEGIDRKKIHVTGNTIVDAVSQNKKIADDKGDILKQMDLSSNDYFLVTAHRAENVDVKERLQGIIGGLQRIHAEFFIPVIFPIHPRTKKMIEKFHISVDGIRVVDPLGYLDFLQLEANSKLILTDSGGVQEESCILGVPCVTLRKNTERPETIAVGSNMLVGSNSDNIVKGVHLMIKNKKKWKNPFGNGTAGVKTINICKEIHPIIGSEHGELSWIYIKY